MKNLADLGSMPLRAPHLKKPTRLDSVVHFSHVLAPTEVDHYQIRRVIDVYVAPDGEALDKVYADVQKIVDQTELPPRTRQFMCAARCRRCDLLPELRTGTDPLHGAGLFDLGRAIQVVC